jgi:hypothetical protein
MERELRGRESWRGTKSFGGETRVEVGKREVEMASELEGLKDF